jgi:hypothetical protein
MVIDWECSRFTKIDSPMTARELYEYRLKSDKLNDIQKSLLKKNMLPILEKYGL